MVKDRFFLVDGYQCCFICDRKGELAGLPLPFNRENLEDKDIPLLDKWLDFLNSVGVVDD